MEARIVLNQSQKNAVDWYAVPANEFEGRDWFNDYYHVRALAFLLNNKKNDRKNSL